MPWKESSVVEERLRFVARLLDGEPMTETLAAEAALPFAPFADYLLRGTAHLSFAGSSVEPCIQAADILAGFAMRFVKDALESPSQSDLAARSAFFDLLGACDPIRATGINLVMTYRCLGRAGIPTF